MAFTSAVTDKVVIGNKILSWGTFESSGGATGGDIKTGISIVDSFTLTQKGAAVTTNAPVVNETFPVVKSRSMTNGAEVTIVTDANVTGTWSAIGKGL